MSGSSDHKLSGSEYPKTSETKLCQVPQTTKLVEINTI